MATYQNIFARLTSVRRGTLALPSLLVGELPPCKSPARMLLFVPRLAVLVPCLFALSAFVTRVSVAQSAQAQQTQQTPAQSAQAQPMQAQPTQDLHPNPLASLRAFEPGVDEPYQLGRGDEIHVDYPGRPELNAKYTVGPDGRITLPLAGAIIVDNLTREQAAQAIVAALGPFFSHLTANVGVDHYTSNRILLLGAIERPGLVTFDRPPTLLEVLTRGGSSTSGQDNGGFAGAGYTQSSVGGSGGGGSGGATRSFPLIPERVAIYRGTDKVMWVEVKGLLDTGSPLADLRLKRDDVVYVPSPRERYVSMLGQVTHPGALLLENSSTLPKLIAEAGGITELAGEYPSIQIIQPSTGTTRVISMKQVLAPGSLDLTLKSGDIIYVPESRFNRSTYILQRISPLVTLFTAAAFFNQ